MEHAIVVGKARVSLNRSVVTDECDGKIERADGEWHREYVLLAAARSLHQA
jgi:hypothetical protein